jgi:hypothetical protein
MGSSLSYIVSNTFMEHLETLALDTAQYKLSLWLRHIYDIFVIWPQGPERLQNCLSHLNSLRPSFQFNVEICSGHLERDDTGNQSLQKTHQHWQISQLQI